MQNNKNDLELTASLTAAQEKYWRFDAEEKARLTQSDPMQLPWNEMLRLNHLCCLEMLDTKLGKLYLQDPDAYAPHISGIQNTALRRGLNLDFWPELLRKLVSKDSPYRPRYCLVWQVNPTTTNSREPDLEGCFMNLSITHFGSIEVIKVDTEQKPMELAFIGFDEIIGLILGRPSLFRAAKLFYEDRRKSEIVWLPLLYGVSWKSPNSHDRDGSYTRFVGHTKVKIEGMGINFGIGIGHQDFLIRNVEKPKEAVKFGLGSIDEIQVALDINDPKFEDKCRTRGLNPDELRQKTKEGK
ncbi:MAG: hypothetical protein ACFFDT_07650 [Candidatus Hodarchaeota archaeon]